MTELNILPECYVDTKVAEIITYASKKYNHQHGCGQIANQLKNKLKDTIALGIIDEDRNKGPMPNYFLEFEELKSENGLILKRHIKREQYLILICPEIEEWLLTNANAVDETLPNHLSENLKVFKQITKHQDIDKNIEFYQFIKSLLKKKAPGIMTLKNWIDVFRTNTLKNII